MVLHGASYLCQCRCCLYLLCLHIILSSVKVAEWPPSKEELFTRFSIRIQSIMSIYNSVTFLFGFADMTGFWFQYTGSYSFLLFYLEICTRFS